MACPHPKKVFAALAGKLMLPLMGVAFPVASSGEDDLAEEARSLLQAALFSVAHIPGTERPNPAWHLT